VLANRLRKKPALSAKPLSTLWCPLARELVSYSRSRKAMATPRPLRGAFFTQLLSVVVAVGRHQADDGQIEKTRVWCSGRDEAEVEGASGGRGRGQSDSSWRWR